MRHVYTSIWYSRFVYSFITHVYVSLCQDIQEYASICYLILVYTRIYANIRVYTKFQTIWKIMHNGGIWTRNLVHTFHWHYHCTVSVHTSVLPSLWPGIYTLLCPLSCLESPCGWCLTSGAGPAAQPAQAMTSPARASTWSWPGPLQRASDSGWHGGTQTALKLQTEAGWETFAGSSWPVDLSKCSEHIAWVRRGHSGPATGTASFISSSWSFNTCGAGHASSESDCLARKQEP